MKNEYGVGHEQLLHVISMCVADPENGGEKLHTLYLTASDTSPDRISRLRYLAGYVAAMSDMSNYTRHILGMVDALHDHKGDLRVTWNRRPSIEMRGMIGCGWESAACGESRQNIMHEMLSKPTAGGLNE